MGERDDASGGSAKRIVAWIAVPTAILGLSLLVFQNFSAFSSARASICETVGLFCSASPPDLPTPADETTTMAEVRPVPAAPKSAPTTTAGVDPQAFELAVWQGAVAAGSIAAMEDYLAQYPRGRFRVQAEQNIARLRAPAESPVSAPQPALNSSGPSMAQPQITAFDGEWYSGQYRYAFSIAGRVGRATLSNAPNVYLPGDVMLSINQISDGGFSGQQIFTNGAWRPVTGQIIDQNTLQMSSGGLTWMMTRR